MLLAALLQVLALPSGGIAGLVSQGYLVTRLFSDNTLIGGVLDWMSFLTIPVVHQLRALKFTSKSLLKQIFPLFFVVFVLLLLLILGRRSVLLSIGISLLVVLSSRKVIRLHSDLLSIALYGIAFFTAFVIFNVIGLARGVDGGSLVTGIPEVLADNLFDPEKRINLIYTLFSGDFVVPFESLPVAINYAHHYGHYPGSVAINGLISALPSSLRPEGFVTVSQWYIRTFFDSSALLNEGRRFFLLTGPYLELGVFGVVLTGISLGALFKWLAYSRFTQQGYGLYLRIALVGLIPNLVTNEPFIFAAYFAKSVMLPFLLI